MRTDIEIKWDFNEVHCDECGESADPSGGGGLVEWRDLRKGQTVICAECIDLYQGDIYAVVLDWRN